MIKKMFLLIKSFFSLCNKKKIKYMVLLFLCIVFLMCLIIDCSNAEKKNNNKTNIYNSPESESKSTNEITIEFTEEESNYLNKLRLKNEFVIAVRKHPKMPDNLPIEDKIYSIFHYNLAKSFAEYLNVDLKVRLVEFDEYYKIDGILPENFNSKESKMSDYNPDLFKTVDLYADSFTISDWNKDYMSFIKIFPVKHFIVTRKRKTIVTINELKDKTIAIEPLTYSQSYFHRIEKDIDSSLTYIYKGSTIDLLESVSVDWDSQIILLDSATALRFVGKVYTNLNSCFSDEKYYDIGWGIKKDDEVLKNILNKFIKYAHKIGLFDELWKNIYNYSFIEYIEMIDM